MTKHNHDSEAFAQFYRRYERLVWRNVAATCPKEEIQDVVGRVWLRVQAKWPFDAAENIEAYLTKAAQNEVKMLLRERSAQKRPPPKLARPLPEEQPSGAKLNRTFIVDPELSGKIDAKNLTENFRTIAEELSGNTSDIMERFLEGPSGVSDAERRKLVSKVKKKVKELGEDVDPLKEGPSFLGHIAKKIRGSNNGE
jgi:DNA-directed RNA polymerase specialized sigma24 family protein